MKEEGILLIPQSISIISKLKNIFQQATAEIGS